MSLQFFRGIGFHVALIHDGIAVVRQELTTGNGVFDVASKCSFHTDFVL